MPYTLNQTFTDDSTQIVRRKGRNSVVFTTDFQVEKLASTCITEYRPSSRLWYEIVIVMMPLGMRWIIWTLWSLPMVSDSQRMSNAVCRASSHIELRFTFKDSLSDCFWCDGFSGLYMTLSNRKILKIVNWSQWIRWETPVETHGWNVSVFSLFSLYEVIAWCKILTQSWHLSDDPTVVNEEDRVSLDLPISCGVPRNVKTHQLQRTDDCLDWAVLSENNKWRVILYIVFIVRNRPPIW